MKFTEGMWMAKEGASLNWMGNVERARVENDQVDVLLTRPQRNPGDTLNVGAIHATIRSPLEGVTAVKFSHWIGEDDLGPHLPLFEQKPTVKIDYEPKKCLDFHTGPLKLSIDARPNELSFDYNCQSQESQVAKRLTGHSFRSIGFVSDQNDPIYNAADGLYAQRKNYMLLELDLAVHEKIYGLGERFGPFIKNGQSVDIWNEDGGTSSELTYKNVPFYMSSRGYGVFINDPGRVMLEIQSERTTRVNIAVQAESLEYMIVAGPSPKDILNRYTALTGRPGLPPAWSFGLWLTTSFTTPQDENTVTGFIDGFKERDIPLQVFHFDAFWMKSFQWCDFVFDDERFPDAKGYLKRIKDKGLKICVWLNPYIAQESHLFAEGKKNGYLIMRADTSRPTVWQWDQWQYGLSVVDFTNPKASKWFTKQLTNLMEMGVDAFKTDFGERIPFDPKIVKYHDGSDSIRMHNFYPYLYNKAVYENMKAQGKEACLFARSATAGGQQFPVHWGGDCESTFEAMAETLRGGLSLATSGFAFWAHDIGGFEGLPPPALYKRWVQFGLLSSHSRLHGSSSYRVPWIYDEKEYPGEAEKCSQVLREAVLRKFSLLPYLFRLALEANQKGTPLMRPMFFEFPEDMNVWQLDTQYMLGHNLLIAPVFSVDGEVSFYVPLTSSDSSQTRPGNWRSWFDHSKTYEEGRWYTEKHGFESLPILVRPGAVLPINPKLKEPEGDLLNDLEVLVNGIPSASVEVEIVQATDLSRVSKKFSINEKLEVDGMNVKVIDISKS